MFAPTGFSLDIFKQRYAFTDEEQWPDACTRVANQMALAELPEKQAIYKNKFYDLLVNNYFVPGGRIWYNSGRNNAQLLNCFVLTNQLDSKEGWGDISREMIITSMTGGGCVDADTEFFTGTKWKKISEYVYGDLVAQYNNGKMELVEPIRYIKLPCERLTHFSTRYGINQTLCDDHRVIYKNGVTGKIEELPFSDLKSWHESTVKGANVKFLTTYEVQKPGVKLSNAELQLMVAFVADGTFYNDSGKARFIFQKQRKYDRLISVLEKSGYPYKIMNWPSVKLPVIICDIPRQSKQFDSFYYDCSTDQLKLITEEILYWDGTFGAGSRIGSFSTSIKANADFIQYAYHAINLRAHIRIDSRKENENYVVLPSKRVTPGLCSDKKNKPVMTSITPVDGFKYCFTVPSHTLILRREGDIFITGNCGIDFSDVRPRGAGITGQKGECPGPVSLMELIDLNARPVRAGGQRRVALMFSLDLDHPDVMEFLDAKLVKGRLTHANVSVRSKRTSDFIRAVKSDGDWELSWKGKYKKTIKAKELWNKIVQNAYNSAEPGFLNWELAENESNIHYIEKLVTTNPCVSGDTPILTRTGYKRIDGLVGQTIEVWNGFEWSEVTPAVTGHNQPMVNVSLSNGRVLNCTEYHTFIIASDYVGKTEEVKAKDLQPGMKLIKHSFPIIEEGEVLTEAYLKGYYPTGYYVPFEGNLKSRLDWLSGLLDSANSELTKDGVQLWSIYREFLSDVQLLLNTLGTSSILGNCKETPEGLSYPLFIGKGAIHALRKLGLSCDRLLMDWISTKDSEEFITVISSTSNEAKETVYCFNEPKRHLGVFNGVITAQCGEIALSSYDCCCLGHVVLPRFVSNNEVNWHSLGNAVRLGVRFLDNVLTVNTYPLQAMKDKSHKLRRIGLGSTGLADMLALVNLKYGSPEGNKFVDKLFRFISKVAYEASIMLAIEKGAFPACDPRKHVESGFMKRMPAKTLALIAEHGIRNCAILTQAPTGTVSIVSGNCSSGIEPMFAPAYERRYWVNEERKTELVFHPLFDQFMKEGRSVDHFVAARDLGVREHMEVQRIIQKHIDNAVSKTINVPQDYSSEDMAANWLEFLPTLKGTTFYRENTRGYVDDAGVVHEPPLKALSLDEARERYNTEKGTVRSEADCSSGLCEL